MSVEGVKHGSNSCFFRHTYSAAAERAELIYESQQTADRLIRPDPTSMDVRDKVPVGIVVPGPRPV